MPYYSRYDNHYRALYQQGIQYWSDGPDHCKANIEAVVASVLDVRPDPRGATLIEMGCGEGHLIAPLVELGMNYTGVEYSPHALSKARERAGHLGQNVNLWVMDVVHLDRAALRDAYDVLLDQACLHLLVCDTDRRRYLANARELMRPDSAFLLLNQARNDKAFNGEIRSIEEYESRFEHDLSRPKAWEAWNGRQWVHVELPSFPCRPKSLDAYLREFEQAGFTVKRVYQGDPGSGQEKLDFVLGVA